MPTEQYCRISSLTSGNAEKWAIEIAWAAARGYHGVRTNIGISASPDWNDPDNPDYSNLDEAIALCVSLDLKVILGIGGEGPPKAAAGWKALNGGTEWTYNRRPVLGTNNAVVNKCASIKQEVIRRSRAQYLAANKNPADYLKIQIGNEPGLGGSGASGVPDPYGTATGDGYWDGPLEVTATNLVCSYLEFLEKEIRQINFYELEVIAPAFEMVDIATELTTFNAQNTEWLRKVTAYSCNLYYNLTSIGAGLGPKEAARIAWWGKDGKGPDSIDDNSMAKRVAAIRAAIAGQNNDRCKLYVTECGFNKPFSGLTTGGRTFTYYERGLYTLALLAEARAYGFFDGISMYNVSSVSSSDDDDFGVFRDDLGTGLLVTTTADIAFARRCGKTDLEMLTPYEGQSYVMAAGEEMPYKAGQGVIAYWALDGATDLTDSIQGFTLTAEGTPTTGVGKIDDAIVFNGVTDKLIYNETELGQIIRGQQAPLYIGVWVYIETSTVNTHANVASYTSASPSYLNLTVAYTGGVLKFNVASSLSDNPVAFDHSATLVEDTWYYLEACYADGEVYGAINGGAWEQTTAGGLDWGTELGAVQFGVINTGDEIRVCNAILLNHLPRVVERAEFASAVPFSEYTGVSGAL